MEKVSFRFTATEESEYMTLGCFLPDDEIKFDTIYKGLSPFADVEPSISYYYFDDFSLIRITDLPLTGDTLYKTGKGDSVTLEVKGDSIINWYERDTQKHLAQNKGTLKVSPDTSTWYRAVGRTDTLDIYVAVADKPVPVFTDTTVCINSEWLVPIPSIFYDSLWLFPSVENNHLLQEGEYIFTSWLGSCSRTDTINYQIEDCEVLLTYPNIFTPNSDGFNDVFVPMEIKNIANGVFSVYNRWGKEVYASQELEFGWDGSNVSDGVYYYSCRFTDRFGRDGEVKGWVVLQR